MRRSPRTINPHARGQRTTLRLLGGVLAIAGAVFTAVGMISFFQAFGGNGPPDKFWCCIVGLPLLGFGLMMLKIGFLGAATRYVAGEVAPVATDTLNYVAEETSGGARKMAGAIAAGLRDSEQGVGTTTACASCGHDNDHDARFCDQCGSEIPTAPTCASCGKTNDPDARFCDGCGGRLT